MALIPGGLPDLTEFDDDVEREIAARMRPDVDPSELLAGEDDFVINRLLLLLMAA